MTSGSSVSVSRSEQALSTENLLPSTNVEIVNLTTKTRQAKIVIYRTRSTARGPAPARHMLIDEVKGPSSTPVTMIVYFVSSFVYLTSLTAMSYPYYSWIEIARKA